MTIRSTLLLIGVVVVSILAELSRQLSSSGHYSFESSITVAYVLIFLNAAIAIAGLWTPDRAAWIAYLVISIALTVLIGAVTPLSVLVILARLFAPS